MEMVLDNGRYVCNDRGMPITVSGSEAMLERVKFILCCRRGKFPFIPKLGSRLYLLTREKHVNLENAALGYVIEALEDERYVTVSGVAAERSGEEIYVTVFLSNPGENTQITVSV